MMYLRLNHLEKSGKVSDDQIKSAQRLTDMVYDIVKKMGHEKSRFELHGSSHGCNKESR